VAAPAPIERTHTGSGTDKAVPDRQPGVVDGEGFSGRGTRQARQVDSAAAGPLDGVCDLADNAYANRLSVVIDAEGNATVGGA
jgi:hypothetical protein